MALKYGVQWGEDPDPLEIEIACIREGGEWKDKHGRTCGKGLLFHFREMQKLLWPKKKWHKWNSRTLLEFTRNRIVGIMGPASSGKTNDAACWALCNYFVWPNEISILCSSTDLRGLELRIWGEIKKYWKSARDRYPWLPGNLLDAKVMITTETSESGEARDFRNGLVGIPCVINHTYVGIAKYIGIKNERMILVADELQFMANSFLSAISNLNSNPNFQCVGLGNPKDPTDALGKLCEPKTTDGGWDGVDNTEKTKTWRTRFLNGICINLVGTDSPNMDVPEGAPVPFPFLIHRQKIADVIEFWGKDSLEYAMQCLGMMLPGLIARRVITRQMCVKFHALEPVVWEGTPRIKLLGLDAAYGNTGGDRCAAIPMEFGRDVKGQQILSCMSKAIIIPVTVYAPEKLPEEQIVGHVQSICQEYSIPPQNVFYDSTGRGTLASAFARVWHPDVVAIEFGGKATERTVTADNKIRCCDHYANMVTELWYSWRYAVEAGQMRNLPEEVMEEGSMREWQLISGNKIQVEPKEKTKEKLGRSPDLADALVVGVEGARRLGFQINRFATATFRNESQQWLKDLRDQHAALQRSKQLKYA